MKASRAAWVAVLLPLITAPWLFPAGARGAWLGVPVWVIYALAATAVLALLIASWMGRWWDRLADEAEATRDSSPPTKGEEQ